jgi:UDP-N-acetylglucosamine 2-epimerase (non-hydrolysing)
MAHEFKVLDTSSLKKVVAIIVGTRPGIVMFAPIIKAMHNLGVPCLIIHSGQHYSPNMDAQFFKDLELPEPHYRLEGVAERKTHGAQTAAMLEGIEAILIKEHPRLVLVGGDANTNLAGALAARKLQIQVGHVEAGERSFDWRMPEEHNRRILDHISEYLFTTNVKGKAHLEREAVMGKILVTGNPIVDASLQHLSLARAKSRALERLGVTSKNYALLTTHREENVDYRERLTGILQGVSQAAEALGMEVLFLAHPRTLKRLKEFQLMEWAESLSGLRITEAVGYLDFLNLLANARLVFTDSGGVQQEAYIHQVPAVTLRDNTEWIETLENGGNRLAGNDPQRILQAAREACAAVCKWPAPFGDGTTAQKIALITQEILES